MRFRFLVCTLLVVAAGVSAAPTHAAGSTSSLSIRREVSVMYNEWDWPSRFSHLYVRVDATVDAVSMAVQPGASFMAQASDFVCTEDDCTSTSFTLQNISPTALNMDPLGNSARITACLTPSTNGPCVPFDISLTSPQITALNGCGPLAVCANAWAMPDLSAAGGRTSGGLSRGQYTVAGTFNGSAFPAETSTSWTDAGSVQSVTLSGTATS